MGAAVLMRIPVTVTAEPAGRAGAGNAPRKHGREGRREAKAACGVLERGRKALTSQLGALFLLSLICQQLTARRSHTWGWVSPRCAVGSSGFTSAGDRCLPGQWLGWAWGCPALGCSK